MGQFFEGLNCLAEAAQIIEMTEERRNEAELHRARCDLLYAIGDRSAAKQSYGRALAVAKRQSAKPLELRAANSLARRWGITANAANPVISSPRSTVGLPKASTHRSYKKPRRCSMRCGDLRIYCLFDKGVTAATRRFWMTKTAVDARQILRLRLWLRHEVASA